MINSEVLPQQRNRNSIAKNAGLIEYLVDSAAMGHAKSSSAGAARLHAIEFRGQPQADQQLPYTL